jgi:polysaccharide export outer membrane protein
MWMKGKTSGFGSLAVAVFLAFSVLHVPAAAQDEVLPKRLVKYKQLLQFVREKKTAGQTETQILADAVKAGWPEPAAVDVILYAGTTTRDQPVGGSGSGTAKGDPYEYHIGAGDSLHISVWDEPTLSSPGVVVRPDGMISMPLLKEIEVAGTTPTEAARIIAQGLTKLKKEIAETDVTVVVTGIQSKKIYAVGAIKREGPIPYTYRMTVMQAISEAGGLTDYAKKKKIYILRHENGQDRKLPFDYEEALNGESTELNIPLLPGDTLVVAH